jgi:hypothetical protein
MRRRGSNAACLRAYVASLGLADCRAARRACVHVTVMVLARSHLDGQIIDQCKQIWAGRASCKHRALLVIDTCSGAKFQATFAPKKLPCAEVDEDVASRRRLRVYRHCDFVRGKVPCRCLPRCFSFSFSDRRIYQVRSKILILVQVAAAAALGAAAVAEGASKAPARG